MKIVVIATFALLVAAVACGSNKMEKVSPGLWVMPEGGVAFVCEDPDGKPLHGARYLQPGETVGRGGDYDGDLNLPLDSTCLHFPTLEDALRYTDEYPKRSKS